LPLIFRRAENLKIWNCGFLAFNWGVLKRRIVRRYQRPAKAKTLIRDADNKSGHRDATSPRLSRFKTDEGNPVQPPTHQSACQSAVRTFCESGNARLDFVGTMDQQRNRLAGRVVFAHANA
jgi:hypothetical protein